MRSEWSICKVVAILLIVSLVSCAQSVEPESMVPTAESMFTSIPTLQPTSAPMVIVVTATPELTPTQTPVPFPPEPTSAPIHNTPTSIVIVVTATPTQTPTLLAPPIFTPTAVRDTLPAANATQMPTGTPTWVPTLTPELTPTPTPTPIPLPLEVTGGIKALVACAGRDEEYWLRNGPPRMTLELMQCLNAELEMGQ